ncbi:MAG: TolB protein, partial [Gammaproteobacteria bacterium]
MNKSLLFVAFTLILSACGSNPKETKEEVRTEPIIQSKDGDEKTKSIMAEDASEINFPEEIHLKNIKQLTNGGDNAEAYWSFDNKQLVFQSNAEKWGLSCDQIFTFDPFNGNIMDDNKPQMVSTGMGRTTCSYFMPDNKS